MADNVYQEIFRLRASDYDVKNRLILSSVLDLCQDVAGKHAELLKVGYEDMLANDKIWMVLRTKVEVVKHPPLFANVLVTTWPLEPNRVDMDRDYLITSSDSQDTYFKVSSKWVACSYSRRMLVRAREIHFDLDSFKEERLFEGSFDKIEVDENEEYQVRHVTTNYLDLDHNGHINNIKYFNFMIISIEELQNQEIKALQIDYVHELKKDTLIEIRYYKKDKCYFVQGISNDVVSFVAKIEIE